MQREKQPSEYALPTIEDIEKIANATDNYRDEFLIWFLESTGVRRRTVPKLTLSDLKKVVTVDGQTKIYGLLDKTEGQLDPIAPILLQIGSERLKGKYRGVQQICFLHFKAHKKLMDYVNWLKNEGYVGTPDTPLFIKFRKPHDALKHGSIRNIVVNACINAFQNGKTFTPHDFRRFHQTQLEKARLPDNWVKKLQGKKLKGEQSPYSLPNILDLHKAFKDAVSYFVPTSEPQPQEHLAKRISQQETVIKKQEEDFNKQQKTIAQLQTQIKGIMEILDKGGRIITPEEEKALEQHAKESAKRDTEDIKRYKKQAKQTPQEQLED
jgi:hypothetical protein